MRAKKQIAAMMPVKKWLSKAEAMSYLDLSVNEFDALVNKSSLSVSCPTGGKKAYFKVSELDAIFQNNLIIKKQPLTVTV